MRELTCVETEETNAVDELYSEISPLIDEIKHICEKYAGTLTDSDKQEVEYMLLSEVGTINL